MFFASKRLMARKKKYLDRVQLELDNLEKANIDLSKLFDELYAGYEYFTLFDVTDVQYWLSNVSLCYKGNNDDLTEAFFELEEQLENLNAEEINEQQLTSIYNIFTVLLNDLYYVEEPILTQTDIPLLSILEKFRYLSDKLIFALRNDKAATTDDLCIAVQHFYTLVDFALNNSPKHQNLRQQQKDFIKAAAIGHEKIDYYMEEIEKINDQIEELQASKNKKITSKKEISPFPTLKAYNNAMKLFVHCMEAVEKYEHEGDLLCPSCTNDIKQEIFSQLVESKDEFDEWDQTVDFDKVAHTILAHTTFDMLASGRYHLYAGILNPLNCSGNLMLVYDKSMEYAISIGMLTTAEKVEQRTYLLKCISEVG